MKRIVKFQLKLNCIFLSATAYILSSEITHPIFSFEKNNQKPKKLSYFWFHDGALQFLTQYCSGTQSSWTLRMRVNIILRQCVMLGDILYLIE